MMKLKIVFAAAFAVMALGMEAQALPAAPAPLPDLSAVTQVRGGCGPGWFRDRWGHCRPMAHVRSGPRCWTQWTAWGHRRVCRW